ncbi:hypothetical protein I7I51_06135 [Histoplasma capsulatum]|uniref:Uncharacterized protein n=1 Tax=Ajellomyces capsulatus TaxID=5037 RepID=A0A8A1MKV1_AJECA|nr:hypothetical protein I7I51_06135 [Histoplasma capsulatum]
MGPKCVSHASVDNVRGREPTVHCEVEQQTTLAYFGSIFCMPHTFTALPARMFQGSDRSPAVDQAGWRFAGSKWRFVVHWLASYRTCGPYRVRLEVDIDSASRLADICLDGAPGHEGWIREPVCLNWIEPAFPWLAAAFVD